MAVIKNAAGIGQATNLAAADARQCGRESDVKYIYQRFVFWSVVCEAIQSSNIDEIQEVINLKNFDDVIKKLKETLK